MSKQVVLEVLRQLLAKICAEMEKSPISGLTTREKHQFCPVTNLSAGEPMSQSTCIDHFQSVTFHLWINHSSFGPNFFFFLKKLIP